MTAGVSIQGAWGDSNHIYGTDGDDTLQGANQDDTLEGGAGNDSLEGYRGNDVIIGGDGVDTVNFSGYHNNLRMADFSITFDSTLNAWIVEGVSGQAAQQYQGADTLYGVERIAFADKSIEIGVATGVNLSGTAGADSWKGTPADDHYTGLAGADSLSGGDGNDTIDGGADNDTIDGGDHNDSLAGGDGNDLLFGGVGGYGAIYDVPESPIYDDFQHFPNYGGDDTLDGGAGNDTLIGWAGDDVLRGGSGHDVLAGGAGNDLLVAGDDGSSLYGDGDRFFPGNSVQSYEIADDGNDTLVGGAGNDILAGGGGSNIMTGGGGNDTIVGISARNAIDGGGTPHNTAVYSGNHTDYLIVSGTGTNGDDPDPTHYYYVYDLRDGSPDGFDTVAYLDKLQFADGTFAFYSQGVLENGNGVHGSHDLLMGTAGNDQYEMGEGDDLAFLYGGDDSVRGDQREAVFDEWGDGSPGPGGKDTLHGGDGNDTLDGMGNDDVLYGDAGNDSLIGGVGDDTLWGGTGTNKIDGGDGTDTAAFTGRRADYTVSAGDQPNTLIVTLKAGGETTTVVNVEHLQFSDVTIAADFNSAPVSSGAHAVLGHGSQDHVYVVTAAQLLAGYSDPDGDALAVAGLAADHGTVVDNHDGTFTLTPAAGFADAMHLSYNVTDGHGGTLAATQTVAFDLFNHTLTGTDGPDHLVGSLVGDTLIGGAGPDTLDGGDGDDIAVFSGSHSDYRIVWDPFAEDSHGTFYVFDLRDGTPQGLDVLNSVESLRFDDGDFPVQSDGVLEGPQITSGAHDLWLGTSGNDIFTLGDGSDLGYGYAGDDTIFADELGYPDDKGNLVTIPGGDDTIHGGDGNDLIYGAGGNDVLYGDAGDDQLQGWDGDDTLWGGAGTNDLSGDKGIDTAAFTGNRADYILTLAPDGTGIIVTLKAGGEKTTVYNIEKLQFADMTVAATLSNSAPVSSGAHTSFGHGSQDHAYVLTAAQLLAGYSDPDGDALSVVGLAADHGTVVDNHDGTFTVTPVVGFADIMHLSYSVTDGHGGMLAAGETISFDVFNHKQTGSSKTMDHLVGSLGDDSLNGAGGDDTLDGGAGNDTLQGGVGNDVMHGGSGDDAYYVDSLLDVVSETNGDGSDTGGVDRVYSTIDYTLGQFVENLNLDGTGNISGIGNSLQNNIYGNDGNNFLSGMNGNDKLKGMGGDDTLSGGKGNDILEGGSGADTFVFLNASANGTDRIVDFEHGIDHLSFNHQDYDVHSGFTLGSHAVGSGAQFLWNAANETLYYDHDGAGGDDAIALATFGAGVAVTWSDLHFT